MAQRTLSRLYDRYSDAAETVRELEAAGIPHSDISLLGPTGSTATSTGTVTGSTVTGSTVTGNTVTDTTTDTGTGAGAGATVGTVIGGGAGLLAGLGSLAIPGVGPLVAAGWLIATLTGAGAGAAAGGLLGALTGAGVEEEDAHTYAEGVRRGGSLITVRVADGTRASEVESILDRRRPVNTATRRADFETTGWTGFDENAGPYSSEIVDLPDTARGTRTTQNGRVQVP